MPIFIFFSYAKTLHSEMSKNTSIVIGAMLRTVLIMLLKKLLKFLYGIVLLCLFHHFDVLKLYHEIGKDDCNSNGLGKKKKNLFRSVDIVP